VIEGQWLQAEPGGLPKRRRFRLTDARGVRRELAALYAEFRNGEVDSDTARTGGFLLRTLLESIRTDVIEERITALETFDTSSISDGALAEIMAARNAQR
jgi:hypothetical protein